MHLRKHICGLISVWHFVRWHFVCDIFSCGILSSGIMSGIRLRSRITGLLVGLQVHGHSLLFLLFVVYSFLFGFVWELEVSL